MSEEIELDVKQVEETSKPLFPVGQQAFETVRKLVLASVGAVALTFDEVQSFVNRLVERGELAQKDAEKILDEARKRLGQRPTLPNLPTNIQPTELTNQIENGLENILNRLNVPSKRDIDELSAKIAQLAARVEELRRSQEVVPAKTKATATAQN